MNTYALDLEKYEALARRAAAEGCVLLENKNHALPLRDGDKVSVFGRSAFRYYKSGLGSGGLVNTRYVTGILDGLEAYSQIQLDERLLEIYRDWIAENPYDEGQGWGKVPWSQKEMPVTEEMVQIARESDAALVVIGRTAGEDQDNTAAPGSYLLTETEEELIAKVCAACSRTIVVLNVGNIIDMKWVEKYHPQAVLCVWQGGQEGGNGAADVLTGRVNPSGRLTDTIAGDISDYPCEGHFGDPVKNIYAEDIYVGYRYFETFAPEKVLYPFGYGLSYTSFETEAKLAGEEGEVLRVEALVKNTGETAGREVVQVYAAAPQGKLGQPARRLIGFAKTGEIAPGNTERVCVEIPKKLLASYDDSGVTGHKSCYVLEEGVYRIYVGANVRDARQAGSFEQEFTVTEQLEEICAPVQAFSRMHPAADGKGGFVPAWEPAPLAAADMRRRLEENRDPEIAFTGDQGYKLADVLDGKVTMDTFVAQLTDEDLICLFRGEGMCSPKVTPGTASAFGGLTERLEYFGIPAACCADGPSGIRMDCGTKAFSLPNGTAIGCTFDEQLAEELYRMTGRELRLNKIDTLLGPGMNIHRSPLNGRNFEYISEDPLVTGKIAAAQLRGLDTSGIAGTVKHYCANNQEYNRRFAEAVVSERALREIYLKGFEIAVKEGHARSVMTTYGPVNGLWTAGNYDLCTTVLRKEWGFEGIVMTDWWAEANYPGRTSEQTAKAPMAAAQNDLYMCVSDSAANPEKDDMLAKLEEGWLTRGDLQRNAKNILGFILKSPSILHKTGRIAPEELREMEKKGDNEILPSDIVVYAAEEGAQTLVIDGANLHPSAGNSDIFGISLGEMGDYEVKITARSQLNALAQLPVSVYFDNALKMTISFHGSEGASIKEVRDLGDIFGSNHYIKLYYGADGLEIERIEFRKKEKMK